MSDCRNPRGRWPPLDIMRRAKEVDDTGLIPFVDTAAAARYLSLSPHSLECYRSILPVSSAPSATRRAQMGLRPSAVIRDVTGSISRTTPFRRVLLYRCVMRI